MFPLFHFPSLYFSIVSLFSIVYFLLFSHRPITSFHFISAIFKNIYFFPFLTTILDEGLSSKRRVINFFSKFIYFAFGSLSS